MSSAGLKRALATSPVASSKGGSDTSLGLCPLPAYPMLGVTMALGIGQAVESEQTAYRLTSQLNALPVVQYLGQAPVVKASVCLAVQDDRGGSEMTCRYPVRYPGTR